ncbi:hypothetical protein [Streptomyces sp. NPDC055134]
MAGPVGAPVIGRAVDRSTMFGAVARSRPGRTPPTSNSGPAGMDLTES